MATIIYLIKVIRGLGEVFSLILTVAELYKLYLSWQKGGQQGSQSLKVVDLEAA